MARTSSPRRKKTVVAPRVPVPDTRPMNPLDPTFPLEQRLSADPQLRKLEAIHVLRRYETFTLDDEWIAVMGELIRFGPSVVPDLIAELDRTDSLFLCLSLGLLLCELNDPRAVPGLIRAIPKRRIMRPENRYSVGADVDNRVWEFQKSLTWGTLRESPGTCGEQGPEAIQGALERITGHDSPGGHDCLMRIGYVGINGDYLLLPGFQWNVTPTPEQEAFIENCF